MGYTIYYNPESKDIIPKTDYDINGDFSDPDKIYNDDDDLLKNGFFKKELAEAGVIFCSMSEAIREHPELVKKYLGSVVPVTDN